MTGKTEGSGQRRPGAFEGNAAFDENSAGRGTDLGPIGFVRRSEHMAPTRPDESAFHSPSPSDQNTHPSGPNSAVDTPVKDQPEFSDPNIPTMDEIENTQGFNNKIALARIRREALKARSDQTEKHEPASARDEPRVAPPRPTDTPEGQTIPTLDDIQNARVFEDKIALARLRRQALGAQTPVTAAPKTAPLTGADKATRSGTLAEPAINKERKERSRIPALAALFIVLLAAAGAILVATGTIFSNAPLQDIAGSNSGTPKPFVVESARIRPAPSALTITAVPTTPEIGRPWSFLTPQPAVVFSFARHASLPQPIPEQFPFADTTLPLQTITNPEDSENVAIQTTNFSATARSTRPVQGLLHDYPVATGTNTSFFSLSTIAGSAIVARAAEPRLALGIAAQEAGPEKLAAQIRADETENSRLVAPPPMPFQIAKRQIGAPPEPPISSAQSARMSSFFQLSARVPDRGPVSKLQNVRQVPSITLKTFAALKPAGAGAPALSLLPLSERILLAAPPRQLDQPSSVVGKVTILASYTPSQGISGDQFHSWRELVAPLSVTQPLEKEFARPSDVERVFVRVIAPVGTPTETIALRRTALIETGYLVDEHRKVFLPISKDQIRFYEARDQSAAELLGKSIDAWVRDFTGFRPSPVPGTIEVWLAGRGPEVAVRPIRPPTVALQNRASELLGEETKP